MFLVCSLCVLLCRSICFYVRLSNDYLLTYLLTLHGPQYVVKSQGLRIQTSSGFDDDRSLNLLPSVGRQNDDRL